MEEESHFFIKSTIKYKTIFKVKISFPKSLTYLKTYLIPAGNLLLSYEGFNK